MTARSLPSKVVAVLVLGLALLLVGGCSSEDGSSDPAGPGASPAGAATGEVPDGRDAIVERVVDGDTARVDDGESVRLIGINTPETVHPSEPVQCFGREASDHVKELLPPGTPVRLVFDVERTDRYDRTLAYVYRLDDGLFLNADLVASGYAEVATYPPNVEHADEFVALQREAREADRGLWQACGEVGVPVEGG